VKSSHLSTSGLPDSRNRRIFSMVRTLDSRFSSDGFANEIRLGSFVFAAGMERKNKGKKRRAKGSL
jgi:hypothetical protein